jgi:YD repeat-containing protein
LQVGSGKRTSIRFASGEGEYIGLRTLAERLRLDYDDYDRVIERLETWKLGTRRR